MERGKKRADARKGSASGSTVVATGRRTGRATESATACGHESTPGHPTRTPAERRIRKATAGRRNTVIKILKVIKCGEEEKNGTRGKKEHNEETINRGKDCKRDRKKQIGSGSGQKSEQRSKKPTTVI